MGLFSVSCSTGDYKSTAMTECKTCPAGEEPNSAKTACGKIVVLILITNSKLLSTKSDIFLLKTFNYHHQCNTFYICNIVKCDQDDLKMPWQVTDDNNLGISIHPDG